MPRRATVILSGATVALVVTIHALTLLRDAGVFREERPDSMLDCETAWPLRGAEDFAAVPGSPWVVTATDDRREGVPYEQREPGEIWILDPISGASMRLYPSASGDSPLDNFHPHGIELFAEKGARSGILFVINHLPSESVIEEFELIFSSDLSLPWTLTHLRTRTGSGFHSLNDLVALSASRLIVSQDHGTASPILRRLEDYSRIPLGRLLLSTPRESRTLVRHLSYANGLALSPDRSHLVAATMLSQELRLFRLDPSDAVELHEVARWKMDSSPDNVAWTEEGLFVASHPKMLRLSAHAKDPDSKYSPSLVSQIPLERLPGGGWDFGSQNEASLVFADGGKRASGVSMGLPVAGKLLLGTIFTEGVLLCEGY